MVKQRKTGLIGEYGKNIPRRCEDEIWTSKCATLVMKCGKKVEDHETQLPNGVIVKDLEDGMYNYLTVLEIDKIVMEDRGMDDRWMEDMKTKVRQDYYRRV